MRNSKFKILSNQDYINTYNELENYCIQHTNILLFGEFGNASFPSISDLDVFICLSDTNFIEDRNKIIDFIDSNEIRKYLFFHDPLILPESFLPSLRIFHTCYNLEFSFTRDSITIPSVNFSDFQFLNSIWTTFLMGIGPNVLINGNFGIRDKLLVLKNVCQSIVNLDDKSDALDYNEQIRFKAMQNELSMKEVDEIFENKLRELYKISNEMKFSEPIINSSIKKIRVAKNIIFKKSVINNFSISNNKIEIQLNNYLYSFIIQLYCKKSNNEQIQNYIDKAITLNDISKKMGFIYPFITPFGFDFYENDMKFKIRNAIHPFIIKEGILTLVVNVLNYLKINSIIK